MKLWEGRFSKGINQTVDSFNASIGFDYQLLEQDLQASLVHALMLAKQGIISPEDGEAIASGLQDMKEELKKGLLEIDFSAEDVHTFIEAELTSRIGEAGKRLHTGRSRNDQVATAMKMYCIEQAEEITGQLQTLIWVLCELAEEHAETILPGYTHLQRAQPITFGHHLLAYGQMFFRDIQRLTHMTEQWRQECPLGSGALAGTTYVIDRHWSAKKLGFFAPSANSLDGVSDRDYCLDLLYACSTIAMHLSRFSEEIILWCSWEFQFIRLDDSYSTGSSIMPQKKNPDVAELTRGKSGRVYGNLLALLTTMKSLPLAYNKDMQEDKEAVFDSVHTVLGCLEVFTPMVKTMTVLPENMEKAAANGFINATDCADFLVEQGMAFRDAYAVTGRLVAYCIENDTVLERLPLAVFQSYSSLFTAEIYSMIALDTCVKRRTSYGAPATVSQQICQLRSQLGQAIKKEEAQ